MQDSQKINISRLKSLVKARLEKWDRAVIRNSFRNRGMDYEKWQIFATKEWAAPSAASPQAEVFLGTCRDVEEVVFAPPREEWAVGSRSKRLEKGFLDEYDGGELKSRWEIEEERKNAETTAGGDDEKLIETNSENLQIEIGGKWLQNAYSTLWWSFQMLSEEEKHKYGNKCRKLINALKQRAKTRYYNLEKPEWVEANGKRTVKGCAVVREYLLMEEADRYFKQRFREGAKATKAAIAKAKRELKSDAKPKRQKSYREFFAAFAAEGLRKIAERKAYEEAEKAEGRKRLARSRSR